MHLFSNHINVWIYYISSLRRFDHRFSHSGSWRNTDTFV